jgi:hypothetical protein
MNIYTAMAGMNTPQKYRAFADTMCDGLLTRRAAARVELKHETAWRWRHKAMAFLPPTELPQLGGITEADEMYFRRELKGSTPVGRLAREHGTKNGLKRCLGKDKVPVVVARARGSDALYRAARHFNRRRADRGIPLDTGVSRCT